jgi:hypothetical protein
MLSQRSHDNDELETATSSPPDPHSEVPDFSVYSEGDPLEGKTIALIIFKSVTCIVFIDEQRTLTWLTNSEYGDYAEEFGDVMGRIDSSLSIPRDLLSENQREVFQRLVGSALARLLDDKEADNANLMLDKADAYLRTRTTERARIWFLSSALLVTAIALLGGSLLLIFRDAIQQRLGVSAFEVGLALPMGALGAFLSMVLRVTKLDIDALAGATVHYFEGAVRVFAGMTGGLFVALCVKANILLGAINVTDKKLAALLVLAGFSGASERLVPNMIKKVEGTLIPDSSERK